MRWTKQHILAAFEAAEDPALSFLFMEFGFSCAFLGQGHGLGSTAFRVDGVLHGFEGLESAGLGYVES